MSEVVTAGLPFTAAGALFIALGVPLLRGRVRPNSWYGCRTEKTLSGEKVWYAVNRVTGRDLVAAGHAVVACPLALLVFGRGMNPTHAVLALLFVLPLSRGHNGRRRPWRSEADVTAAGVAGKPNSGHVLSVPWVVCQRSIASGQHRRCPS